MRRKTEVTPETLHQSGEDYLEAILVLCMTKGNVHAVDVANFLNYSKPSVSNAVCMLRETGYVTVDEAHCIHLTEIGRGIAETIYERHRFFTDFFVKIGVEKSVAEADACQIEHVISAESFARLKAYLETTEPD